MTGRIDMLSRIIARLQAGSVRTWVVFKDNRAHRLCYRPRIEALEERLLLATDTWTGTTGNAFWSYAANWDHGVPSPGDDLVFPVTTLLPLINDLSPGIT